MFLAAAITSSVGGQVPTWTLREDLRIGTDGVGPTEFSEIRGLAATADGTIFVLDFKAAEVRVFDSKGTFLRIAARRGDGPGEIQVANGLAVGADDIVWVSDPGHGRFSAFSPDGRFLRQIAIPIQRYGDYWTGVVDPAGRIVDLPVRVPTSGIDPRTNYPRTEDRIRRIRADGRADTVASSVCGSDPPYLVFRTPSGRATSLQQAFTASPQVAVTRLGTVWCTPRSEYRLLTGPIGAPLKEVVRLAVAGPPVTPEERDAAIAGIASFGQRIGSLVSGDPKAIPSTKPPIARLFTDDQGWAWVQRTQTDSMPSFDLYDRDGRPVAIVKSRGPVGQVVFVDRGALYTVVKDADDVPVVVRYRIQR